MLKTEHLKIKKSTGGSVMFSSTSSSSVSYMFPYCTRILFSPFCLLRVLWLCSIHFSWEHRILECQATEWWQECNRIPTQMEKNQTNKKSKRWVLGNSHFSSVLILFLRAWSRVFVRASVRFHKKGTCASHTSVSSGKAALLASQPPLARSESPAGASRGV